MKPEAVKGLQGLIKRIDKWQEVSKESFKKSKVNWFGSNLRENFEIFKAFFERRKPDGHKEN